MPEIVRALLAANHSGLWLANRSRVAIPNTSHAPAHPVDSLYRITPGQRAPDGLLSAGPDGAHRLAASGTTATIAVSDVQDAESIVTITGDRQTAHGRIRVTRCSSQLCASQCSRVTQ